LPACGDDNHTSAAPTTAAAGAAETVADAAQQTNDGKLAHVMVLLQAAPGLTSEGAFEMFDSGGVAAVYGSYVARPGEDEVLTVDLVPGNYMMVCYLPTADGTPHLAMGMAEPFTVS
jgi:hypothetical protein